MKTVLLIRWSFILFLMLSASEAFSQLDTSFAFPSGYTNFQLRYRNSLKVDASGNVWVGFKHIGAGVFNGTTWTMYNKANSGLPGNNVKSIAFDGNITWLGTDSGLAKFDGVNWMLYDSVNSGLLSNNIKLLHAQGSDLWLALNSGGLQKFNGTTWSYYSTANGLASDTILCFGAKTNSVFVGTQNGISEFRNGTWINYNAGAALTDSNKIVSIAADGNDSVFASTAAGQLYILAGIAFQPASGFLANYCNGFDVGTVKLLKSANGSIAAFSLESIALNEFSTTSFHANYYDLWKSGIYLGSFLNELCDMDAQGKIWQVSHLTQNFLNRLDYLQYWPPLVQLPPGQAELNINEVVARLQNDGCLFWDGDRTAKYIVPKGDCEQTALFCQGLWLGGLDQGNNLHMAAQTYRQSGSDFWPGPLDTITCSSDSVSSAQFNHIWVVDRRTIIDFITNFNNGNVTNGTYAVPPEILSWPGNGYGAFDHYLAPFTDVSPDGIYDPYTGDYPDIKGDQMAWWVMNDTLYSHGETGGAAFGVEIQVSAYAYSCPYVPDSEMTINYTTFYSYRIINRSIMPYHDVYVGLYTDVDLGNFTDDFLGCDVDHDFGYGYNGDAIDEGFEGYGENPPVISVAILKGPDADIPDGLDNNHNGTIDETGETCMMNHFMSCDKDFTDYGFPPSDSLGYYRFMQSLFNNTAFLSYGGNGHSMTGDSCNYAFPGSSDPNGYGTRGVPHPPWTEYTAGRLPGDRRFLMTSGPFTLGSGDVKYLDVAIVYSRDTNSANYPQNALATNLAEVQKVKNWWNTNTYPSNCVGPNGISDPEARPAQGLVLYPNPAEVGFFVDVNIRKPHAPLHYELKDVTGRILKSGKLSASGQYFSLSGVARGMYFVHVYGDGFSASAKMIHR